MKAVKPWALMQIGMAARTAASRTKSVRERPRNAAARSMMAMSAGGSRMDKGWPLRSATLSMAKVLFVVSATA
jgi:hypothetical protein